MGDMADAIIDGDCCQICCEFFLDDESPGYPRTCAGCGGDESNDGSPRVNSSAKKARKKRQRKRQRERKRNELAEAAKAGQFTSWRKCSEYHYQKTIDGIPVNWWPSSRKIMVNQAVFTYVENEKAIIAIVQQIKEKSNAAS